MLNYLLNTSGKIDDWDCLMKTEHIGVKILVLNSCNTVFAILFILFVAEISRAADADPQSTIDILPRFVSENPRSSWAVIFVHGLEGNSSETWTYNNDDIQKYWPNLIHNIGRLDQSSIFVHEYETTLLQKTDLSISSLADQMNTWLRYHGLDEKILIFVAHSLGGIIIKEMLLQNADIATNTYSVNYFGTPFRGSSWATLLTEFGSKSPVISALREIDGNLILESLSKDWESKSSDNFYKSIRHYCAFETLDYPMNSFIDTGDRIVSKESATHQCNRSYPIKRDHVWMVKPRNRGDEPHVTLTTMVKDAFRVRPECSGTENTDEDYSYWANTDKNSADEINQYLADFNCGVYRYLSLQILFQLTKKGSPTVGKSPFVSRKVPSIQIRFEDDLGRETSRSDGDGIKVLNVREPGTSYGKLMKGDVIFAIYDQEVRTSGQLKAAISELTIGGSAVVHFWRNGNEMSEYITVALKKRYNTP